MGAIKGPGLALARKITGRGNDDGFGKELRGVLRRIEDLITEYPGVCLGIAFSVGAVLGWAYKRR